MPSIGTPEVLLLFVILMVLFGASRLPGFARALGQSVRELRAGRDGER